MAILRHADFSITMEIYSQVSSKATREALRKLGESLDQGAVAVLYCCTRSKGAIRKIPNGP